MRDLDGKFQPSWKGVECIARHLERKHWSNSSESPVTRSKKIQECEDNLDKFRFEFQKF